MRSMPLPPSRVSVATWHQVGLHCVTDREPRRATCTSWLVMMFLNSVVPPLAVIPLTSHGQADKVHSPGTVRVCTGPPVRAIDRTSVAFGPEAAQYTVPS